MNILDISKHQSTFAASAAKAAGVDGVILRHAYGESPDTTAAGWAGDISANGLRLGGYGFATWHYKGLNGGSEATARQLMTRQVERWIQLARGTGAGWWFAIDQELEAGQAMGLGMAANTRLINEAAGLLRAAGLRPCLYCSVAWDLQYVSTAELTVPYWMARYYDGKADFADAGADLDKLPDGQYTRWMRQLRQAGRLIGWQFASTGLGARYGAGSANLDRNIFYADPEGYDAAQAGPVQPQNQAMYLALGPLSGGDADTFAARLEELAIGWRSLPQADGLTVLLTKVACSTGDQAELIRMAVDLQVPVRLLNASQAAEMAGQEDAPEEQPEEKPEESYSLLFLGLAVKGGFSSPEEAREYLEAVLGAGAMELPGLAVTK